MKHRPIVCDLYSKMLLGWSNKTSTRFFWVSINALINNNANTNNNNAVILTPVLN